MLSGFSTRQRETAELTGGDWELNHRQRVKEERMRREDGIDEGAGVKTPEDEEKEGDDALGDNDTERE